MTNSDLFNLLAERVEAITNESPHLYGLDLDNRWAAVDNNEREVFQMRPFNSEFDVTVHRPGVEYGWMAEPLSEQATYVVQQYSWLLGAQCPKEIIGFPNINSRNNLESKLQLSHQKYIAYPRISILKGDDKYRKPSEEDVNKFLFGS